MVCVCTQIEAWPIGVSESVSVSDWSIPSVEKGEKEKRTIFKFKKFMKFKQQKIVSLGLTKLSNGLIDSHIVRYHVIVDQKL